MKIKLICSLRLHEPGGWLQTIASTVVLGMLLGIRKGKERGRGIGALANWGSWKRP